MPESRVLTGNSLLASLSLFLPLPKTPGVSSSRIQHACRLALYILSSPESRLPAGSFGMAELCLGRV